MQIFCFCKFTKLLWLVSKKQKQNRFEFLVSVLLTNDINLQQKQLLWNDHWFLWYGYGFLMVQWMMETIHSKISLTLCLTVLSLWWLLTVAHWELLQANVAERAFLGQFVPREPSKREFLRRCSSLGGYLSAELRHLRERGSTL